MARPRSKTPDPGSELPKRREKKPRKRRPKGDGTIFKDEDRGVWVGRKVIGRLPSGRPRYKEVSAEHQEDVVKKLKVPDKPAPGMTVSQWADRWLSTLTVRPTSRRGCHQAIANHIRPSLGHLILEQVTAIEIETMSAKMLNVRKLNPNTVKELLGHAGRLFQAALRSGLIKVNPVSLAKKPKRKKVKIDPFKPPELAAITKAASAYSSGGVIAACAATGCRVGEALGLDVPDFDTATGTMTVRRTYDFETGTGPPKTENGYRTIKIPDLALPAFRAAAKGRKSGVLFATRKGTRHARQSVSAVWKKVLKAAGFSYRRPHQLRHSVASALVGAGVPIADVARYLGDVPETVTKFYVHPTGVDPSDTLNRLFS